MKNEVIKEELTINAVPKAVNYLIEEVAEMRSLLDKMEKQLGLGVNKHRPILTERAAEILHMKVGTIRRLVAERAIPHYKREQGISDEMTMENEIEWMKKKADFIDPFVNFPDDLLSEEDIETVINPEII